LRRGKMNSDTRKEYERRERRMFFRKTPRRLLVRPSETSAAESGR
jgi:hypothetical protein